MEGVYIFIIKSLLVSGIMTTYYWFILRNKNFHYYNRFYLIASGLLSVLVPFVDLNWYTLNQPQSFSVQQLMAMMEQPGRIALSPAAFPWERLLFYGMVLVSIVLLLGMLKGIFQILQIKRSANSIRMGKINFIETSHQDAPFSFFSNLFWQKGASFDDETGKQVFRHELTHIEQRHTHDKLLVGVLSSLFWMNPFFWIIRKELQVIHEFIADEKAIDEADASALAAMLLKTHYQGQFLNTGQSFFYSSIKRRLFMLTHSKKTSFSYLRRLLVLPISFLLLLLLSFSISNETKNVTSVEVPQEALLNNVEKAKKDTIPTKYLTADGKGIKGSYLVDMHGDAAVFMDPKTKQVLFAIPIAQLLKTAPDQMSSPFPSIIIASEEVIDQKGIHWDTSAAILKQLSPSSVAFNITIDSLAGLGAGVARATPNFIISSNLDSINIKTIDVREVDNKPVIFLNGKSMESNEDAGGKQVVAATRVAGVNQGADKQIVFVKSKRTASNALPNDLKFIVNGKYITQEEMSAISPDKIQSINVLKGEAAVKRYGESSSTGVVEITLKK